LDLSNQWIGLGPSPATIVKLSFDPLNPHTLYGAGYGGAFFRTLDGGKSWESLNSGIENLRIQALAIDPFNSGTLYVGDLDWRGIFKNTDYGQSWTPVSPLDGDFGSPPIWDLAVDPLSPDILYAGTQGGVYKTTDGGASWNRVSEGISPGPYWTSTAVVTLAIDPVNPNILYAGTESQNGLFKSTDGGGSWILTNKGIEWNGDVPAVFALAIDPSNSNVLYAGTYLPSDGFGYGVFKSSDGGQNWNPVNTGILPGGGVIYPGILSLVIDPLKPTTIYAGTANFGVFKSTDAGGHWKPMDKTFNDIRFIISLAIDPLDRHTLFAGTFAGVFKIHQPHGRIKVRPTSADFGDVPAGEIHRKTITVGNDGPRGLILGTTNDPADPFSVTGNTCRLGKVLTPGTTCKITLQFAPLAPGTFTSSFMIDSDDPDNPKVTVNLSGTSGAADVIDKLGSLRLASEIMECDGIGVRRNWGQT
jgi:hypothetical protein